MREPKKACLHLFDSWPARIDATWCYKGVQVDVVCNAWTWAARIVGTQIEPPGPRRRFRSCPHPAGNIGRFWEHTLKFMSIWWKLLFWISSCEGTPRARKGKHVFFVAWYPGTFRQLRSAAMAAGWCFVLVLCLSCVFVFGQVSTRAFDGSDTQIGWSFNATASLPSSAKYYVIGDGSHKLVIWQPFGTCVILSYTSTLAHTIILSNLFLKFVRNRLDVAIGGGNVCKDVLIPAARQFVQLLGGNNISVTIVNADWYAPLPLVYFMRPDEPFCAKLLFLTGPKFIYFRIWFGLSAPQLRARLCEFIFAYSSPQTSKVKDCCANVTIFDHFNVLAGPHSHTECF